MVLSDFLATDWERPLRRLAARHEVVAVTVDDPRERTLPDAGVLWLEDAESGQLVQVDTTARRTRDALARHTERRRLERARMITSAGRGPGGAGGGAGLCADPAAGIRGAGAPAASRVMLLLLALLQQGAPTVGDTIWLVRTVAVPSGSAVRPAAWNPTGDLETLGPPRVTTRGDSVEIAYPVVVWLAGSRTVDVPGPLLLLAGGGVDSIPAERMTVTVASVLPAGVPDSLLRIQPAAQPVVRGERTLRSLHRHCCCWRRCCCFRCTCFWRRRGKPLPRVRRAAAPALPLERWADAGEVRVVLAAATSALRDAIARAVPEASPAVDVPQVTRRGARRAARLAARRDRRRAGCAGGSALHARRRSPMPPDSRRGPGPSQRNSRKAAA